MTSDLERTFDAAVVSDVVFGTAVVHCAELFSPDEAASVADAVRTAPAALVRQAWDTPTSRMHTIGEALYRNRDRLDHYVRCARNDNPALYRYFRPVYERVATFFERRYGEPVMFAEELAVPGFHVFEYVRAGSYDGGGWHFDCLYQRAPFLSDRIAEIRGLANFTLPLEVPSGGTGMDLCDDEPGAVRPGGGAAVTVPYEPGVMVFTEREYWHRIGTSSCLRDGERRVTLQGHGVHLAEGWLLFW
jgi:hypothetical protein